MSFDCRDELQRLLGDIGLSLDSAGGQARFSGQDPILGSRLRLAASISLSIMAAAQAAASVWKDRSGRGQDLHLDLRQAIHQITPHITWSPTLGGSLYPHALVADNPFLLDSYKTKDGRTVMASGVYPHMASSWLRWLDCPPDKEKVAGLLPLGNPKNWKTKATLLVCP